MTGNEQDKLRQHQKANKEKSNVFHIGSTSTDPYEWSTIGYQALQLIGYPLEFTTQEPKDGDVGSWLTVSTDSESNWNKIRWIHFRIFTNGINQVLIDIEDGRPHRLAKLLRNQEDDYYQSTPQSPKGSHPNERYNTTIETLKRCYIRAYRRYYEKVRNGTMYFEKQGDSYGPFTATPNESDIKLYEECESEGLKPITSDELIEMTKKVAEEIVDQLPRFKPD